MLRERWGVDGERTHRVLYAMCVVLLLLLLAPPGGGGLAAAEPRIALVIGNNAYTSLGPLSNPVNDMALMARTLRDLDFEVIERADADQVAMKRAIQDFGQRLEGAGRDAVGLFYFAGHGVQINGTNFLIPVGAEVAREPDVEIEAVKLDWVLAQMEHARNRLNILILDACRNNPLSRGLRSSERGLSRVDAPRGTLIAYATAPGSVSFDGQGLNSPYTEALADAMQRPGLVVESAFRTVRVKVMEATGERQVPWESSSLTGEFYFSSPVERNEAEVAAGAPASVPPPAEGAASITQAAALAGRFASGERSSAEDETVEHAALPPPGEPVATRPDPALVRIVQQKLDALGFTPGPVDGAWGRKTEAAIRSFQQAAGLEATAALDHELSAALDAAMAGHWYVSYGTEGTLIGRDFSNRVRGALGRSDLIKLLPAYGFALSQLPPGESVTWRNPETGHGGRMTVGEPLIRQGKQCRLFDHEIEVNGRTESARDRVACRDETRDTWLAAK
jgi:uncharacterized caspase-like protein/surface antigen